MLCYSRFALMNSYLRLTSLGSDFLAEHNTDETLVIC